MEAETLRNVRLSDYPIRLTANNGQTFDVESPEFIMVSDYEATVMVKREGGMRNVTISILNLVSVESIRTQSLG